MGNNYYVNKFFFFFFFTFIKIYLNQFCDFRSILNNIKLKHLQSMLMDCSILGLHFPLTPQESTVMSKHKTFIV